MDVGRCRNMEMEWMGDYDVDDGWRWMDKCMMEKKHGP